jgi:4-carboxymuconolactone decarboxylase
MKTRTVLAAVMVAGTAGWLGAMAWNTPAKSQSPRFPLLTMADLNDQQRPVGERIMKFSRAGIGGPYHIMLRSPEGASRMLDLLDYLRFHSSVPVRLNEFAILIQGRLWRSQMEWWGHYPTALKAGVSAETLAELKAGRRPTSMKPDEAAVYDFCMELYTTHQVSDPVYARLKQYLNDQQIVDLTTVSGTYVAVASLLAMAEQGVPPGEEPAFKPGEP